MAFYTLALALWLTVAAAFPFRGTEGVTELDGSNFDAFINTHKPVMVMFYAPWCGHCKALHPEFVKFGAGMKGLAAVGAVNVDKHQEFGSRFGIKGFPTIKFWLSGSKKGQSPQEYNGQRTASGLNAAALAAVDSKSVAVTESEEQLQRQLQAASTKTVIVAVSSKGKPPPMLSVLSHDPKLKGLGWAVVPEKMKELVQLLNVTKVPSIVALKWSDDQRLQTVATYNGVVEYGSLSIFATRFVGADTSAAQGATPPRLERPTGPLPLQGSSWADYCTKKSEAFSRLPLCVLSIGGAPLDKLFDAVANEPVVLFYATSNTEAIKSKLSRALGIPLNDGATVAIRYSKGGAKAATREPSTGIEDFVLRIVEGSIPLRTVGDLPSLP